MRENAVRFKLAYSLPMLSLELSNDLGRVGEGRMSLDALCSKKTKQSTGSARDI